MADTEGPKHSLSTELEAGTHALDIETVQNDLSGVQTLVRRVKETRDKAQSQMIEELTKNLETFYRGALNEIKDLPDSEKPDVRGSMTNLMKHISTGEARGYSPKIIKESLQSWHQLDDQIARATQNFEIRSAGLTGQSDRTHTYATDEMKQYMTTGAVKDLQHIALQHGMDQEDAGLAYRIGSRNFDNPYEATAFVKEVAKLRSLDQVDVEQTATGLEAVSSAWGISGYDLSKVTDMMLMAANISQVSIQDLIKTMQQTLPASGEHEGDMTKVEALARSIAKASMAVQATEYTGTSEGTAPNQANLDALADQLKLADGNTSIVPHSDTRDNVPFRQSQIRTAFQIATHEAMEGLKEEFGELEAYLISFMRLIGDHASGIADHMELVNRIMEEAGVQVAWEKFGEVMSEADQKRYGNPASNPIGVEDVRWAGVIHEMGRQQNRLGALGSRRAEVQTSVTAKQDEMMKLKVTRDGQHSLYGQAIQNGNEAAASRHANERALAEKDIRKKSRELRLLREELDFLDEQMAKTKRSLEFMSRELDENSKSILQLEHQARILMMAMDDMDLDSTELRNKLYFLNSEFQYGSTDVERYEAEVQKLRKQAVLLIDTLSKLRGEVNDLNASFRRGLMDVSSYIAKLKELEQAQLAVVAANSSAEGGIVVLPGGKASAETPAKDKKEDSANKTFVARHEGLIKDVMKDAIMDGVDMGGSGKGDQKTKKRGLFSRFKDMRETGNRKAFFDSNAPVRNESGDILRDRQGNSITQRDIDAERVARGEKIPGKFSKLAKTGMRFLRPLKAVPALGVAMTAMDVISGVVDPLNNMGKSEAEKQSIRATNKEELAKDFKDMEQSSFVGKVWKGLNLGMDAAVSGTISTLFGNSATNNKLGDYWEGFKAVWNEDGGDAVEKKLAKEYNYEKEKKEAQLQIEKETGKKPDKTNATQVQTQTQYITLPPTSAGSLGAVASGTYRPVPQSNGIDEMISKINGELSKSLGNNETNYQVTRSRLLISGVREDSGQMRELMEKYLRENIKFFDKAIASLQKTYDKMAEGKEKDEVGQELNEKKQQKAQSELELNSVKNSKIDELKRRMTDQLELTQMDYDKRMYDLLAANGGKEDAPEVVALNKARAQEMNSKFGGYEKEWNNLLKNGGFKVNSDEYMTVLKEMRSIGVEQSKNLAEISKKMDKPISTFNIPTGLKVMDYFDYMTTNNTHKSVMVGAGDVTVHVNIDNMTGSTKDVEKLSSVLNQTLRQNNPTLVNRMAGNVGAGMGSNYPISFIR